MTSLRVILFAPLGFLLAAPAQESASLAVEPVYEDVGPFLDMPATGMIRLNLSDRKPGWQLTVQSGGRLLPLNESQFEKYRIYGTTLELPVRQPGRVFLRSNGLTGTILWEGYTRGNFSQQLYRQGGKLDMMDAAFAGKPANALTLAAGAAIVRVRWSAQGRATLWCTGTQVAPGIVLTNRHCFPPDFTQQHPVGETAVEFGQFRGSLDDVGEAIPSDVIRLPASQQQGEFYERDIAVLKLRHAPASPLYTAAILKLAPSALENTPAELLTIWAYGPTFGKAVSRDSLRCRLSTPYAGCIAGALLHYCEAESGSSGSPILDPANRRILALHYGGIAQNEGNCAIPAPILRGELAAAGVTGI